MQLWKAGSLLDFRTQQQEKAALNTPINSRRFSVRTVARHCNLIESLLRVLIMFH